MYKLLLCWRYLRTRWIALASVISVTLGVATMAYLPFAFFNLINPLVSAIYGYTGFKIVRIEE